MIFAVVAVMFAAVACGGKTTEEVGTTDTLVVVEEDTTLVSVSDEVVTDSLAKVEPVQ